MRTLPIGSVTLDHILDLAGGPLFHIDFPESNFQISHVTSDSEASAIHYLYIRLLSPNAWAYCLEINPSSGESRLFTNSPDELELRRAFPYFNLDDRESIEADFLETVYALLHKKIENPLHNKKGQVRMKTILIINSLVGETSIPKQSLAIWTEIAKTGNLVPKSYVRLNYHSKFVWFATQPFQIVDGRGAYVSNYVLRNLGYSQQSTGKWISTTSSIPNKYLKVMQYSTRVPEELGFKLKEDKPGKFNEKFKNYYQRYVKELETNSSSEYNPLSPVYLGLELEYEVDVDYGRDGVVADSVMPLLYPHGICKSDGSLDHGIEVVTVPAVYEDQVEGLQEFFKNFPTELSVQSTCGLHIHISRAPFNLSTQGRIIAFMNSSHNTEFLEKIGGRGLNSYARQDCSRKISSILGPSGDRYNVLNLRNSSTLEFRLFSGTYNLTEVKRAMQFCLALAEYCKNLTMNIKEFTKHENFTKWLTTQRKDYPDLCNFLLPRKSIPQQFINKQQSV